MTEHAHVTEIKTPAEASNNHNYDPQICRYLDCSEKCRMFELATSLAESDTASHGIMQGALMAQESDSDDNEDAICIKGVGLARPITNYFAIATCLAARDPGSIPIPLRSFMAGGTAINLSYDPSLQCISINDVAEKFGLPTFVLPLHTTFTVSKLMVQVTVIPSVAAIVEQAILLSLSQTSKFGSKYAYRTRQYTIRQKYSQHRLFIAPLPATPGHLAVTMQLFSMLTIVVRGRGMA